MDPSVETIVRPTAPLAEPAKARGTHLADAKPGPVFCISCNYDLLGIDAEGRCPECGFAVAESLKPEVRGFAGLLALRRFRLGLWLLAFMPLVVFGSTVLRFSDDLRRDIAMHFMGPIPSWHHNQAANRAYWNQVNAIEDQLAGATTFVIPISIALPLLLVVWRGRSTRDLTQRMVERPHLISWRTGSIAFGSIIAMSMIPISIVYILSQYSFKAMLTPAGFAPIVLIWLTIGVLTWWLVSKIISGRVRVAFIIAALMLLVSFPLVYRAGTSFWGYRWHYGDAAFTLAIAGMTLIALGSGLLWRWVAKGFLMRRLTVAATLYAAAVPVMVALGYNSLAETFSSLTFALPTTVSLIVLAAGAGFAAFLGVAIGWNLFRIRLAQR